MYRIYANNDHFWCHLDVRASTPEEAAELAEAELVKTTATEIEMGSDPYEAEYSIEGWEEIDDNPRQTQPVHTVNSGGNG